MKKKKPGGGVMKNDKINKELDQILNAGLKNEEINASPFFTTRVMGKVEQLEDVKGGFSLLAYVLKPAFALLIIINVANFYFFNNSGSELTTVNNEEVVSSDYIYASSDFVYSEDLVSGNLE